MKNLAEKIPSFPSSPGVYRFLNKDNGVIYIGKAKNLRARVKQYFQNHDDRPQIPFLLSEAVDIDYTVVKTELESLYLERTLIQKYKPKYNIQLRDDKSYTFIAFDYSTQIPQILITRRIADEQFEKRQFYDESKGASTNKRYTLNAIRSDYFGPYTAAYKVRELLKTVRYIFPFCTAPKVSNKPCFYYHLHRCPGVCVGVISVDEYKTHLEKIKLFLKGDVKTVKKQLENEMKAASTKKLFEKAARLRNQLHALTMVENKQSVIIPKKVAWDVIGLDKLNNDICVTLMKVRDGKLMDKENFSYRTTNQYESTPTLAERGRSPDQSVGADAYRKETLKKFLEDYYFAASDASQKIYVQDEVENAQLIQKLLKERFGKTTKVIHATQKQPLNLVKIAGQNAGEFLRQQEIKNASDLDKINSALQQLKDILKLPGIPKRIECYDISNIQGTNAVGSMVVFVDGKPAKSQYRKFKIKSKTTPDDFAMMKEMLSRRLARSLSEIARPEIRKAKWAEAIPSSEGIASLPPVACNFQDSWPLPDLIVIDGGKGQLGVAVETINHSQLTINVIGLAKRIEEIFLPNNPNPIVLPHDQPALQLLQRLRDEAHRFGITFHRQLRSKQAVRSVLDEIPGIGPKTKKLLKQKFGTVAEIRNTSIDELTKVVGQKLADIIKKTL
jgi:excinuclease ABC subunit C